jgi:competence protein ComEA
MKRPVPFFFDSPSRSVASLIVLISSIAHLMLSAFPIKTESPLKGWWDEISIDSLATLLPEPSQKYREQRTKEYSYQRKRRYSYRNKPGLMPVNLNTLDSADWIAFGLSPRQIEVILSIRKKKGSFASIEEVLELPYISDYAKRKIAERGIVHPVKADSLLISLPVEAIVRIDLNSADSAELMQIKGLGRKRCAELLELRRKLGAFHSTEILFALSGIDSLRFIAIEEQIVLTPAELNQWNLNRDSRERLLELSLLPPKVVHRTMNHRLRFGPFKSAEDWKKLPFVGDSIAELCRPYLIWE